MKNVLLQSDYFLKINTFNSFISYISTDVLLASIYLLFRVFSLGYVSQLLILLIIILILLLLYYVIIKGYLKCMFNSFNFYLDFYFLMFNYFAVSFS